MGFIYINDQVEVFAAAAVAVPPIIIGCCLVIWR